MRQHTSKSSFNKGSHNYEPLRTYMYYFRQHIPQPKTSVVRQLTPFHQNINHSHQSILHLQKDRKSLLRAGHAQALAYTPSNLRQPPKPTPLNTTAEDSKPITSVYNSDTKIEEIVRECTREEIQLDVRIAAPSRSP